jgi:hypothetical protein
VSALAELSHGDLLAMNEELRQTNDELQRDLAYHRRRVTRLTNELNEQRDCDPRMKDAQQIYRYWVHVFNKTENAVFGPARQKAVLARLKEGKSVAYIKRAIEGCKNSEWHVEHDKTDLELICRDEVKLDRFYGLADHLNVEEDGRSPIEKVIAALEAHDCTVQGTFEGSWTAHCPAHEDRNASLSLTEKDDGTVLLNCHAGCSTE